MLIQACVHFQNISLIESTGKTGTNAGSCMPARGNHRKHTVQHGFVSTSCTQSDRNTPYLLAVCCEEALELH